MMGRQILIELSEDEVRALEAAGDPPRHIACNCGDYPVSERPCRFCAGMPVGVLQKIQDVLRGSPEAASLQGCPVHQGAVHGGEAEELRSGIEALIAQGDVAVWELRELLESVDARDSLGHLERIDLGAGIAAILADDDLTSGAVRAALRRLLDGT